MKLSDGEIELLRHAVGERRRSEENQHGQIAAEIPRAGRRIASETVAGPALLETGSQTRYVVELFSQLVGGREPRCLFVTGPAGSGKTCLILESLSKIERTRFSLVTANCRLTSNAPLLAEELLNAFVDLSFQKSQVGASHVRRSGTVLDRLGGEIRASLSWAFPGLRARFRGETEVLYPPEVDRLSAGRNGVCAILESIVEETPLIVWIDDAQWLGPELSAPFRVILEALARVPALLIVTSRDETSRWSIRMLGAGVRAEHVRTIELRSTSAATSVDAVVDERAVAIPTTTFARSMRDVVSERISRVSPTGLAILSILASVRDSLDIRTLSRVLSVDYGSVEETLHDLARGLEIVRATSRDEFGIGHHRIREAIHQHIAAKTHQERALLARQLQSLPDPPLASIAAGLKGALQREEAGDYYCAAGRRALAEGDWWLAAESYRQACDLIPTTRIGHPEIRFNYMHALAMLQAKRRREAGSDYPAPRAAERECLTIAIPTASRRASAPFLLILFVLALVTLQGFAVGWSPGSGLALLFAFWLIFVGVKSAMEHLNGDPNRAGKQ